MQIPLPANLDITQLVHYTESESNQARLSLAKTDMFLVPVLDIAKLNAFVEPYLANSRLQYYLKGNAPMFAQYLLHLKNKLPTFKMFRKTWRTLRSCNGQFNSVKLNSKNVKKLCNQLVKNKLIPYQWMQKPQLNVSVKKFNMQGPRIQASKNQVSFSCLLDYGSTFSIMPYHVFNKLNISEFQLNTKTKYNIN